MWPNPLAQALPRHEAGSYCLNMATRYDASAPSAANWPVLGAGCRLFFVVVTESGAAGSKALDQLPNDGVG